MKSLFGVVGGVFTFSDDFLNSSYTLGIFDNPEGFFLYFFEENFMFCKEESFFLDSSFLSGFLTTFLVLTTKRKRSSFIGFGNGFRVGLFYYILFKHRYFFLNAELNYRKKFYKLNDFLFSWVFTHVEQRSVLKSSLYEVNFILGKSMCGFRFLEVNKSLIDQIGLSLLECRYILKI